MKNYKSLILLTFLYCAPVAAAEALGRLFLTPAQRTQLETVRAQRDRRLPIVAEPEAAPAPAPTPQGPDTVTYNGVVRRSDGRSTVWINGKPVNERSRTKNDSDVSVLGLTRDGKVSVAIPQAGRTGSLKVGQSLEVASGRIAESYARRAPLAQPRDADAAPTTKLQSGASLLPNAATKSPAARTSAAALHDLPTPQPNSGNHADSGSPPEMRVPGN